MQKRNSFLLGAKAKLLLCAVAYCVLAVILVYGSYSRTDSKTTAIVYAEGKTMATPAQEQIEETAEDAQIQYEEDREQLDESTKAMQFLLANDIAEQVKKQREKKKEREAKRIHLSEKDKKILLRIVEAEATGEDIKGKMLVANVILNRVNSDEFPNTVEKVVFENRQFSPIRDGRYYKVNITKDTRKAVERVLNGEDSSRGALYFMSRKGASPGNVRWFDRSLTKVLEYGTHEFFK